MMMKRVLIVIALLSIAACGGSSSSTPSSTALKGLASCTVASGEAVICGTVYAADGVTPIIGTEIQKSTASGSLSKLTGLYYGDAGAGVTKGVPDTTQCITDSSGEFACSGIATTGTYTFIVSGSGVNLSFSATATVDATTTVPTTDTTASSSDTTTKWLVVQGSFDGVQLLLSQLKGCTLTGDVAVPSLLSGSTECTTANLTVVASSDLATTFDALSSISTYSSIFINCETDMTAYATVLQEYVAQGGNLYFSDLSADGLTAAFPDKITFDTTSITSAGDVTATVDNTGLATFLESSSIDIAFDLSAWQAITSVASGVTTYISGDTSALGGTVDAPITVGWKQSTGGCIFYTSYHIEGASTGSDQEKALKYLIQNIGSVCE